MTLRRCLRCRIQSSTTQLIPLHLDAGGSLIVGRANHGRGGWICPSCIGAAVAAPGAFNRCFRKRVSHASDLPESARKWINERIIDDLRMAIRHGLLIPKNDSLRLQAKLTLLSSDHPTNQASDIKNDENRGSRYTLGISSIELGRIMNQAPRFEVKLKPGRSTQSLLKTLRVWDRLG